MCTASFRPTFSEPRHTPLRSQRGSRRSVTSPSSSPRPSRGSRSRANLVEEYSYDGLRVVSIDKNVFPDRRVRDSYEQPAMRHVHERVLRKLRPDVVHVCHLISHTTALLDVTRRMGIPTFATLTDFFGFCYNNILENTKSELCAGPDALRANCMACFLKLVGTRQNAILLDRSRQSTVRSPTRLSRARLLRPRGS